MAVGPAPSSTKFQSLTNLDEGGSVLMLVPLMATCLKQPHMVYYVAMQDKHPELFAFLAVSTAAVCLVARSAIGPKKSLLWVVLHGTKHDTHVYTRTSPVCAWSRQARKAYRSSGGPECLHICQILSVAKLYGYQ